MNTPACSIVLIPGFMLDEALWNEFIAQLPEEWSIIHAPLEGGESVRDIAGHIVEHLPPRFVLIGFSLGGYIARQLAADYPERVDALIIIASSLRDDTERQRKSKQQAVEALSAATFKGLSDGSIAKLLHPDHIAEEALITYIRDMGRRLGYQALVTQSQLDRSGVPTSTIRCPTLIIASATDPLRSIDEAHEIVEAIPDASLQVL